VKLRNGPAAVTGNICFAIYATVKTGRLQNRFNAGSQKTNQVIMIERPDGKRFCKTFALAEPFLFSAGAYIARKL